MRDTNAIECSTCGGEGWVPGLVVGDGDAVDERCGRCGGRGHVETRCGLHGDDTSAGRCEACDGIRAWIAKAEPNRRAMCASCGGPIHRRTTLVDDAEVWGRAPWLHLREADWIDAPHNAVPLTDSVV